MSKRYQRASCFGKRKKYWDPMSLRFASIVRLSNSTCTALILLCCTCCWSFLITHTHTHTHTHRHTHTHTHKVPINKHAWQWLAGAKYRQRIYHPSIIISDSVPYVKIGDGGWMRPFVKVTTKAAQIKLVYNWARGFSHTERREAGPELGTCGFADFFSA